MGQQTAFSQESPSLLARQETWRQGRRLLCVTTDLNNTIENQQEQVSRCCQGKLISQGF